MQLLLGIFELLAGDFLCLLENVDMLEGLLFLSGLELLGLPFLVLEVGEHFVEGGIHLGEAVLVQSKLSPLIGRNLVKLLVRCQFGFQLLATSL